MEHSHGFKMQPNQKSAVYHYHFHYIIDSKQAKEKILSKVGSDSTLPKMNVNHQDSDKQSTSSHQSWKRLINPAFQTQQTHKIRSFKSTSPTAKKLNLNLDIVNLKTNQPNTSEKRGYMTPKTLTKRQRTITNTSLKNRQQQAQELRENSFGSINEQYLIKINPQNMQKSSFSKKNAGYTFEELQQKKQAFQTQSTKISTIQRNSILEQQRQMEKPSQYAYNLLKQECQYLRGTFLRHYIKNHLIKSETQKK